MRLRTLIPRAAATSFGSARLSTPEDVLLALEEVLSVDLSSGVAVLEHPQRAVGACIRRSTPSGTLRRAWRNVGVGVVVLKHASYQQHYPDD